MDVRGEVFQFMLGCCGGLIAESLHWHRIAKRGRWPKYAKSSLYWILTCILIFCGGIVAAVVSGSGTSPIQLLLLGIVGPQLLEATARSQTREEFQKALPKAESYLGPDKPSVGEFLAS